MIEGSFLKSFHNQSIDNLKGFDPTQSIVFNSKVFHDSKENSPITSPRRQSIVSEYTNYSEYTDLLKSNLKNKQITNSQMSLPENLEDNQALQQFHKEFMGQLDMKDKQSADDKIQASRDRNDTFDTNPMTMGSIKGKSELEETVKNNIYKKAQFMTDSKKMCQSQVFDLQKESPESNQINQQVEDFNQIAARMGSMGHLDHRRRESTQINRKSEETLPSPKQEKSAEDEKLFEKSTPSSN